MSLHLKDPVIFKRTKQIMWIHSTEFADYFYQELLRTDLNLAWVFRNTNLSKQKGKLIEGVERIFELLDEDEKKLTRYLNDLGVRHICYEVTEKHYPVVKEVLLKAVKHVHQSEWNQEYENWWNALIAMMTDRMIAGCHSLQRAS